MSHDQTHLKVVMPAAFSPPQDLLALLRNDASASKTVESIEFQWIQCFFKQEFYELELGAYFPKIYRALPKLYHRDQCFLSKIKKPFTHLPTLKKLSIDRAICSLYRECFPKRRKRVVIVAEDLVDVAQEQIEPQEIAAILRNAIQFLDIEVCPLEKIDPQKVDLILQISPLMRQLPFPAMSENMGASGFLESAEFYPKIGNRSMGLHALEKGVFISPPIQPVFDDIEHTTLRQWLFESLTPSNYALNHRFHMACLATPVGGMVYLHSLLKMWEKDSKAIDLCCPDLSWCMSWLATHKGPFLQESFNVKEIEIYYIDQKHVLPICSHGKIVRILCPGLISRQDSKRLFALSEEWVSVRGDQSLSDALSANKTFFYDASQHTQCFLQDLIALVQNRLGGQKAALSLFQMMGQASLWNVEPTSSEWVELSEIQAPDKMPWADIARGLGESLQDPSTFAFCKILNRLISQEHALIPFLCHLVQKKFFHLEHPDIQETEERLIELYAMGKIPFSALVKKLMVCTMGKKR